MQELEAFERKSQQGSDLEKAFSAPDKDMIEVLRSVRPEHAFKRMVSLFKPWCAPGGGALFKTAAALPVSMTVAKASMLAAVEWEKAVLQGTGHSFKLGVVYRAMLKAWGAEHAIDVSLPPLAGLSKLCDIPDLSPANMVEVGFNKLSRYPKMPDGLKAHQHTSTTWSVFTGLEGYMGNLLFIELSDAFKLVSLAQVSNGKLSFWRGYRNLPGDVCNGERLHDVLVAFIRRATLRVVKGDKKKHGSHKI